ncbi:hypothetical protein [Sabulicella glaciei]|uniref:Uncharacterized protein n=1 Tax=Sabulicella glaciei TaxID=2984948 RepID=A0ABT3NRD6_9PROT|nr:hypothetical protein [Roseococcus sp. MDT2-1-1]MCW8084724.1 hypothetical protein [Roseococcus sp. MDT2-1-1]
MSAAPIPAKVAKLLPLLGSDKPGEVTATAAAIGRTLTAAGLDWHALALVVERHTALPVRPGIAPAAAFSFGALPPRGARKALALLATRPGLTRQQVAAIEVIKARLLGAPVHVRINHADAAWLDALWHRAFGDKAP